MAADETEVYRALSSASRLNILRVLADKPENTHEIARRTSLTVFTIKLHLRTLQSAGLIEECKSVKGRGGPSIYYRLSTKFPSFSFPRRQYQSLAEQLFLTFRRVVGDVKFKEVLWEMGRRTGRKSLSTLEEKGRLDECTIAHFKEHYLHEYLTEAAGKPEVTVETDDSLYYKIHNCPFFEMASKYTECFCGSMEEGLRDGFMEATKGKLVLDRVRCITSGDECCEFKARTV